MKEMVSYLYSVEVQKDKDTLELSLLKKGLQQPLFTISYRKFKDGDRYVFVKNENPKKNDNLNYELISCFYFHGKDKTPISAIKKSTKTKRRIVRFIKNSKVLRDEFRKVLKTVNSALVDMKHRKIGNLTIYYTNKPSIADMFSKLYLSLHKIR